MSVADLIRKLSRLSGEKAERSVAETPGEKRVLDGRSAVVAVERLLGSSGGVTSSTRATPFAAAAGLALNGIRATAYLGDEEPSEEANQIRRAASRHVALVAHLACRASASHGRAIGTGHDGYHALADSGAVLLFATNVQEAVDLTLAARRFTERALVPCLIAMDDIETAGALQDVILPTVEIAAGLTGPSDETIESPTPAQAMLFGAHRRRLPRLFDFDHPALGGALHDTISWGHATAAARPFFDSHIPMILEEALAATGHATGRKLKTTSLHGGEGETLLLVAQGSAVEIAHAAAAAIRREGKESPAVLAIRSIAPFPREALRDAAAGRTKVVVLERAQCGAGGDGPLTGRIRAAVPSVPIATLFVGLGGTPLRADELARFCTEDGVEKGGVIYLGIDFIPGKRSPYPKRQAVIDKVRRDYPDAASLGFRHAADRAIETHRTALSAAVARGPGKAGRDLSLSLFTLVQQVIGGTMRSRIGTGWGRWGDTVLDSAVWGGAPREDEGDESPADLLIFPEPNDLEDSEIRRSLLRIRPGGALLAGGTDPGEQIERIGKIARSLPAGERLHLHYLPSSDDDEDRRKNPERILGAAAALLGTIDPAFPLDMKKLVSLREETTGSDAGLFREGAGKVQAVDLRERRSAPSVRTPIEEEAPAAVRNLVDRDGAPSESLARFWDQVGVLYARGDEDSLTADPFLASGLVPGRSAIFHTVHHASVTVPRFDPSACTACGRCWAVCPEGAIGAVVLSGAELIGRAMTGAKEQGRSADAVKRVLSRLAKEFSKAGGGGKGAAGAGDALRRAFESISTKGGGPADPKQLEAIGILDEIIGALPVTSADILAEDKLFLAIDPDRCKGCGVCIASCDAEALLEGDPSADDEVERKVWKAYETVCGTPDATITRLLGDEGGIGEGAALFLPAGAAGTLSGTDGSEPGSGARSAIRILLAAAERHMRPILCAHARHLAELEKECSAAIRELLAGALPVTDLDRLADGIAAAGKKELDLSDLAAGMEDAVDGGKVDAGHLAGLVEGARDVAALRSRLAGNSGVVSRAPHGLVLAAPSVARWAAVYPHNPFAVPAVVDTTAHAAPLAEGLALGEIRNVAATVRLERRLRERLAAGAKKRAAEETGPLSRHDWTEEERKLCSPLLVIFDDESLEQHGSAHISRLLHSDLPIKVVLLSRLDPGGAGKGSEVSGDAGLVALAHTGCFTLQSSIAHADHLAHGLAHALSFPGPAFIRIHAPSPLDDGFPADGAVEQARLAVWSRAFPLFQSDPCRAGEGKRELVLEGNPSIGDSWAVDSAGRTVTYAHWAVTEERFADHFRPLPDGASKPTPLEEYVSSPAADREGTTPFIIVGEGKGETRIEVSESIAVASEEHLRIWKLLRDLAGLTSDAAAAAHAEEIAALARQQEAAVAAARAGAKEDLTALMQSRLRALAGVPDADGEEEAV